MHKWLIAGLLGAALSLSACQDVSIVDDVDLTLDWKQLLGPSDQLHTPYIAGSRFNVYVRTARKENLAGWRLESGDGNVVTTGSAVASSDGESLYVSVQAERAGAVELRVRDADGEVRHTRTIDVKLPDRVEVLAHGPLLIDRPVDAPTESPRILEGGTATFLLRPYAEGEKLSGNGAFTVAGSGPADPKIAQSYLFEDRDWLQVKARTGTAAGVDLRVLDTAVRTLPVQIVPESAIARVELRGQTESNAVDGEIVTVLAQAYAADEVPIWGVDYEFAANGIEQIGEGDLYRYKFDEDRPVMLEAAHGSLANGLLIHSGGGYVDSTNRIGCSMTPGANGSSGPAAMILAALVMMLQRRRVA